MMAIRYASFQDEDAVGWILCQACGDNESRSASSYDDIVIGISWKLSRGVKYGSSGEASEGYSQKRLEDDRRDHCGVAKHLLNDTVYIENGEAQKVPDGQCPPFMP